MHDIPPAILNQLELKPPATEQAIEQLLAFAKTTYETSLPEDYLAFLRFSDGCCGIGPNLFVTFEPAAEIGETTIGYGALEFAPGAVIIGSDGCGNIIGIDTRPALPDRMTYFWVDPIVLDWNEIALRTPSLADLLVSLDRYYCDDE